MEGIGYRVALIVLACALIAPAHGSAREPLGAPIPGAIAVRFGEVYAVAGSSYTHRGLDILGQAGDPVAAPCRGRVRFAGQVPADGGGRCGAVTVETGDGALVTVMPLQDIWVDAGAEVEVGRGVGELAPAGDASCVSPHVHLSLRIGGRYVDPEPLLVVDLDTDGGGSSRAEPVAAGGRRVQPSPTEGWPSDDFAAPAIGQVGARRARESDTTGRLVRHPAYEEASTGASLGARVMGSTHPAAEAESVRRSAFRSIQAMQRTSAAVRVGVRPVMPEPGDVVRMSGVAPAPWVRGVRGAWLWAAGALSSVVAMRARRTEAGVHRTG